MYDGLSKQEMEAEAKKLMAQGREDFNVEPKVATFIQDETANAMSGGRGTNTVVYFDVSSSMMAGTYRPWDMQRAIIKNLIPTALEYSPDGIDLIAIMKDNPLAESRKTKVKEVEQGVAFVDRYREHLKPSTPTCQVYRKEIEDHVAACIQNPTDTKRLNSIVITDGKPTDAKDNPSMTETTKRAILGLNEAGLDPKEYLGMSYVIITEDFHTMASYRKLDNCASWGPDDQKVECDISNATYPYEMEALGGCNRQVVINIILAANNSEAVDGAAEKLVQGPAKGLNELMDAYIKKGYANEV